ncbi:enoyl-CoA hydratase/isomerase family protein [Aromatoleum toluclasticum]|uniref:enoyl-CoA hydratase/isomerase family protein n=1 Tax=Aromatoleum toluclasticum TaxID=92003 RepID=UPI001D192DCB|nr:enoyl-CoA hydratase/isomerase family protein [Aromatoleum toluclasticum]MCC4113950.1 enoyl-CoA hydratase/isomerase family protein [Aromatoleum toluclasticum]
MFSVETRGSVVRITMQRSPVNALNNEFVTAFDRVLDDVEGRPEIAVMHLRSDQKAFCGGADLAQVETRFAMEGGANVMVRDVRGIQRLFDRIESLPCVTLAEIGSAALGGGFELALACDLRIVANEARLGLPETRLGLLPGAGGTQRLTRLCGPGTAARIILAGDIVDGLEACRLGMVQWSVPAGDLAAEAAALAERIGALSVAALRASKRCIARVSPLARSGYEDELQCVHALTTQEDTQARIGAFFARRP